MKLPEVQRGSQSLGEAVHLILERVPQGQTYDRSEVQASKEDWDKAEQIAKIALPLLPGTPASPIKREQGFRMATWPGGPTMVGYVDLGIPVGIGWPAFLIPDCDAIVGDYKTLSDFRYMRTPQELADSVQMMSYAKWAIEEFPMGLRAQGAYMPEHVRLVHMYMRTKPPFIRSAVRYSEAMVTPDQINVKWENTLDTVRKMEKASLCSSADDVDPGGALNGHCEAYGGCSFRDKCGVQKSSGIKTLFQIQKAPTNMSGSSILEKIKAAQAAKDAAVRGAQGAATSPSPSPSPSPAPTPSPAAPKLGAISTLLARIEAKGKGTPSIGGELAQALGRELGEEVGHGRAGTGEMAKADVRTLGDLMKLAAGIVPPDAPSRAQSVITRPGDAVVEPLTADAESEGDEEESESEDGVSSNAAPSGNIIANDRSNTGTPVAKRRGRPSNAELAERKAREDAELLVKAQSIAASLGPKSESQLQTEVDRLKADAAHWASQVQKLQSDLIKAQQEARPAQQGATGLTLYIDCYPVKGDPDVLDFFEWVAPICAEVAQANSVGDWRMIQYTSKGLLASAIREAIRSHGLPKNLSIQAYAGGADIAIEILTPLAKRVIKKL